MGNQPICSRDNYVSQSDSEQQLRIWKDLAISKQMLMNDAANALKLKDDFTSEDLKTALETAVKRARDADDDMANTRVEAEKEITDMQLVVRNTEKTRSLAEADRDTARQNQTTAEQQLANGRKDNAEAIKKAKRQVEDKQKELRAINLALADTPENIVKKLKALKKQKLDEANGRKFAEDANRVLKKDNKKQKAELEDLSKLSENSQNLLESYREIREWADQALKKLISAEIDVDAIPDLDANVLAEIEAATAEPEETREAATA